MIWLVEDFGLLSVILRAIILTLQTLVVGGIFFALLVLTRDGETAPSITARTGRWIGRFSLSLAVAGALYIATDSAILSTTTGIAVQGLIGADVFQIDNVTAALRTDSGETWSSTWDEVNNKLLSSAEPSITVPVYFAGAIPRKMKTEPVHYQFDLAITELRAQTPRVFVGPRKGMLTIPNFGLCNAASANGRGVLDLDCRIPLRKPDPTEVSYPLRTQPCSEPISSEPTPHYVARGWEGQLDEDVADVSLTPVSQASIYFQFPEIPKDVNVHFCPGDPITFTPYRAVRRFIYRIRMNSSPLAVTLPEI